MTEITSAMIGIEITESPNCGDGAPDHFLLRAVYNDIPGNYSDWTSACLDRKRAQPLSMREAVTKLVDDLLAKVYRTRIPIVSE